MKGAISFVPGGVKWLRSKSNVKALFYQVTELLLACPNLSQGKLDATQCSRSVTVKCTNNS